MIYPPARARTLHSAIGRHGGAAGPGTTSPALIRSNPTYRIVKEDREDDIVIGDEWRGEEVPRRPGASISCLPRSFLHISCLICSPFRPSLPPSVSLHLSHLLCSLSVLPSLLSISLSAFTSLRPHMDGSPPASIDGPEYDRPPSLYLPPSIDAYEHGRWYA